MTLGTKRKMRGVPSGLVLLLALAPAAHAQRSARDEVDAQLRELMGKRPTRVKVTFEGFTAPGYALEGLELTLDGAPLPTPPLSKLTDFGTHVVYEGDARVGDHRLDARVILVDKAGVMMSSEPGYTWKVGVTRTFNLTAGLEVAIALEAVRVPEARDPRQKFKLSSTATPRMLVALDDGRMPEPVARPPAPVPDAGPSPAELAALAKQQAEAEKQRLLDEARAAKAAAEEEKRRKAEELQAAKLAAAEERKRQVEEAKAAKLAAAEERKRQAEEAKAAQASAAVDGARDARLAQDALQAAAADPTAPILYAIDAGEPSAAEDAGGAIAVIAPPAERAPQPPAPPAQGAAEDGSWGWLVGAGVVALGVVLFLLARRRANPRDPGV